MKRIIITERQYNELVNKKKTNKIVSEIYGEVNTIMNSVKHQSTRNNAMIETIKKYDYRGTLKENVIKKLIDKGVDPVLFEKAGIKIM